VGDVRRSARQAAFHVRGKGDRDRVVPVPPRLLRRLDRHIDHLPSDEANARLFVSLRRDPSGSYEPLTESGVAQIVRAAAARAGIAKKVHPHLIRHSWMTEMLRSGMNPIQLSVIAGASPQVIAEVYAHLTEDDAFDAMMRALTVSEQRKGGG
jgi:integrase/recombinase XerD